MTKMEDLRELAGKLRAAHAAEGMAEKAIAEARKCQSYWRGEIIKVLGQEEAIEFLDMLREQGGFLTSDDLIDVEVLRMPRRG